MKRNDLKNDKCCGCKACSYICPKNAITFVKDELGFEYPEIDETQCVDCHKCERKCPVNSSLKKDNISVYAAVNKNNELLMKSASGGAFSALAESVLREGGIVYGAAMARDNSAILKVVHIRVDNINDLTMLQGSKYLQSDMSDIYSDLQRDLKQGKVVLFSGTPCQNAAVRSAFGDVENLLLVDIICHGVPSQKMFSEYLHVLEKKNRSANIINFTFRTKESGWGLCAKIAMEKNGRYKKIRIPCNISSYYKMFLRCEIYRKSCYTCPYATKERVSDLTLGDYWGVEKISNIYDKCKMDNIDITKGISCVISSSAKGERYLKKTNMILMPSDFESVAKENGNLKYPSPCPDTREAIMNIYNEQGYMGLEKQFNKTLGVKKYFILLRNRISPKLRMKIKILLGK